MTENANLMKSSLKIQQLLAHTNTRSSSQEMCLHAVSASNLYADYNIFLRMYNITPREIKLMDVIFSMTDATGKCSNQLHQLQIMRKLEDMWYEQHMDKYTTFVMRKIDFLEKYAAALVASQQTPPGSVCMDPEDKFVLLFHVDSTKDKRNSIKSIGYAKDGAWKTFVLRYDIGTDNIQKIIQTSSQFIRGLLSGDSYLQDVGKKTMLLSFATGQVLDNWILAKEHFIHQQQPLTVEERALVAGAAETLLFESFLHELEFVEHNVVTTTKHLPPLLIRPDLVAQAQKVLHPTSLQKSVSAHANSPSALPCTKELFLAKDMTLVRLTNQPHASSVHTVPCVQTYGQPRLCGCTWSVTPPQLCSENTPPCLAHGMMSVQK